MPQFLQVLALPCDPGYVAGGLDDEQAFQGQSPQFVQYVRSVHGKQGSDWIGDDRIVAVPGKVQIVGQHRRRPWLDVAV